MEQQQKPIGLNVGSASIIMIFAVLCLTIFSALSLITAISEKETAEKYAASTEAYYQADYRAEEIRQVVENGVIAGNSNEELETAVNNLFINSDNSHDISSENTGFTISQQSNVTYYSYAVPLGDEISQLSVVLTYDGSADAVAGGDAGSVETGSSTVDAGTEGALRVVCWKKTNIDEWAPDQSLTVWNFEG